MTFIRNEITGLHAFHAGSSNHSTVRFLIVTTYMRADALTASVYGDMEFFSYFINFLLNQVYEDRILNKRNFQ